MLQMSALLLLKPCRFLDENLGLLNTQSDLYTRSLFECVIRDFENDALWDTH